jgi:hypothetical protein
MMNGYHIESGCHPGVCKNIRSFRDNRVNTNTLAPRMYGKCEERRTNSQNST